MNIVFACVHYSALITGSSFWRRIGGSQCGKAFPHAVTAAVADQVISANRAAARGKFSQESRLRRVVNIPVNWKVSLAIADEVKKAPPACVIMVGPGNPPPGPEFYQQENSIGSYLCREAEEQIIPVIAQHLLESSRRFIEYSLHAEKFLDSSRLPVPRKQPDLEKSAGSPYLDGIIDLS